MASRTSNLLDIRKPDNARNDFAEATFSEDFKTVELQLERFKSRPRKQPGGSQVCTITLSTPIANRAYTVVTWKIVIITVEDHKTKRKRQIQASVVQVDGRKALLAVNEPHKLMKMTKPKAINVMTIGKDEPSAGEDQLRDMILQRLLGRGQDDVLIEKVPLVKLVWGTPPPEATTPAAAIRPPRPASKNAGATTQRGKDAAKAVTTKLNASQARAVAALCNPLDPSYQNPLVQIVQGPPGSGKTTMIAAMVQWLCKQSKDPIYLVTQSNTAVKNIAEKLENCKFRSYKLIVSHEFKTDWYVHLFCHLFAASVSI